MPSPENPRLSHLAETLTDLVVERLLLADGVAVSKFLTGSPVDDPAREERVLEDVRNRAGTVGLDPDAAVAFFRDQFDASKVVQAGLFARWAADPDGVPTTRPDLDRIRDRIDLLTARLLQALGTAERPVRTSAVRTEGLAETSHPDRLDALHRHALQIATRSVRHRAAPPSRPSVTTDAPARSSCAVAPQVGDSAVRSQLRGVRSGRRLS
ncbi:gamma subclass chorismate mutase AroQ [Promicromonospora sp. NPDC059942]|uniref:gamma subclass chorismate mutase AroQ n=1 Tax=Promicromonospora sp. NPDC059942 TaxID=3347009 RepID=UPI0036488119